MRRLRLSHVPFRDITSYGSHGLRVGGLSPQGMETGLTMAQLAAEGVIGSHAAVAEQVLVVLRGGVEVTDADGATLRIGPGSAVWFDAGEVHETRGLLDSLLMIIEGDLELSDDEQDPPA